MGYLLDLKTQKKPTLPADYPDQYAAYRAGERPSGQDMGKSFRIYRAGERPAGYVSAAAPASKPVVTALRGGGSGSGYRDVPAGVGEAKQGPWGMTEAAKAQVALVKDWMVNELIPQAREQEAERGMLNSGIAMQLEADQTRKASLEAERIMSEAAAEEGRLNQQVALANARNILDREMGNQSGRSTYDQFIRELNFRTSDAAEKNRLGWADNALGYAGVARQSAADKMQYGAASGASAFEKDLPGIVDAATEKIGAGSRPADILAQIRAAYPGVEPSTYPQLMTLFNSLDSPNAWFRMFGGM